MSTADTTALVRSSTAGRMTGPLTGSSSPVAGGPTGEFDTLTRSGVYGQPGGSGPPLQRPLSDSGRTGTPARDGEPSSRPAFRPWVLDPCQTGAAYCTHVHANICSRQE